MANENKIDHVEQKLDHQLGKALAEIEALAEEIRVQVHLAGMDAKDAWAKLEPRLADAKRHVKGASQASLNVLGEVKLAFGDFASSLHNAGKRPPAS